MNRILTILFLFLISSFSFAQTCPGDINILEDENLSVWKVESNGTQIFSIAGFVGTINIGDSTYFQEDIGLGETGLVLMAHDISGSLLWSRKLSGISYFTTNPGLAANTNNVYVAATSVANGNTINDFSIESYSALDGSPLWSNSYQVPITSSNIPFGAQVNPYSAALDGTGKLIIAGAFSGAMDICGTVLTTTAGLSETFVMAVDEVDGTDSWAVQSTGSNGRGRAWTVEVDNARNIIIGGHYTGTITFGVSSFTATDPSLVNPYVAKLNPADGSAQWVVGMDNVSGFASSAVFDNIYDLTVDGLDNIYFAGNFTGEIEILGDLLISAENKDWLIGSLTSVGTFRWSKQFGGPSTADEFATTIEYSANSNSLFIGGQLATGGPQFNNINLDLPPTNGHFVIGISTDGAFEATAAEGISQEGNFGYSAVYIDGSDTYISASLINNTGTNISAAQWIPNRPVPLAHISQEDGLLDPTETLTAFDPGGGQYTYQWYFNGAPIADEVNSTYLANLNGFYSLEVANSNGCSNFSEEITLLDGTTLESDSLALVDFYNKTNGPGWSDNTNWLTGDVSTWTGVSVNLGRVTEINLGGNNLAGNIPASIGNLSELNYLFLNNNQLSGNTPTSLWNLSNLIEMVVHDNPNLRFSIEPNIGLMTQLVVIRVFETNITGVLPVEIGNATNLIELNMYTGLGHSLSGSIPAEIGNLTNLQILNLGGGNLTGPIPTSIGNLTNLTYLAFWDNDLSGSIPTEIGNLTALQQFYADDNQLFGTLPSQIGNLTELREMNISRNSINGPLPTTIGNLDSLIVLELHTNPINDVIPVEIGNMDKLEFFLAENCNWQGAIPDELWHLPTIKEIVVSQNPDLDQNFPDDLETLTQLQNLTLWRTKPTNAPFPEDLYSLTNLLNLDVGGLQMTGEIDSRIGNLVNLHSLYLWGNQFTGDFPTEINNITGLQYLSIGGDLFNNFPNVSSIPELINVDISNNNLDFNSIVPNIGIPEFSYAPQRQRGVSAYFEVNEGEDLPLVNDYSAAGNTYQWVRNATDSIATSQDFTIAATELSDLGGYFAWVTNPGAPDLTLRTRFYNVAFDVPARSWTVDNDPESLADFKSLYAGIYGTNTGDTLYVAGSDTPYYESNMRLEQQRIIYGPGYFLGENPETQASLKEALAPSINIAKGSEGTEIYGMTWNQILINNQASAIDDTVRSIHIVNNKINEISINDDSQNILISKNFINQFTFASTPLVGVSRSYQDIFIENNIIDTVTTVFAKATVDKNVMSNVNFTRNTINVFTDSIESAILSNNIINDYQATANTNNGTIDYAGSSFADNALLVDNDFVSTTNVDAGAFSGSEPYVLSGLPPAPHIYELVDAGRIRFNVKAKNENPEDIAFLNYKIGQGGNTVLTGTVRRLEAGNPVEVLFRPKVSALTPGGTYNMMIWTKDANGIKSIHHNAIFTAETASAGGQIFTSTNQPVTSGEVLLFEINQEQTAFDTLQTTINNQGQFTFGNIVVGDYLALGKANISQFPDQLPTYFTQTDLWEEADTLLIDASSPTFDITLLEDPKEDTGAGVVAGTLVEELDEGNSGGRIEARGRVAGAGVSMRRARRTGRTEEIVYELVDYTFTDENGEFYFENLPADNYRINIQYPGYPMDTLTNVDLIIEETKNNNYSLEALVDEGKISVTILSTTGILKDLVRAVNVYPNPTVEKITIAFNEDFNIKGNVDIELISTTGEMVYRGNYSADQINKLGELSLPVSQYHHGAYLLRITQQKKEIGAIRIMVVK
jgi:Leucine-rich repeat (LRR) protein